MHGTPCAAWDSRSEESRFLHVQCTGGAGAAAAGCTDLHAAAHAAEPEEDDLRGFALRVKLIVGR